MKKITLLALLCCICMSHAFADGFIETDGFTFTGHNHIVGEPKWKTLSNGGKVPVEAYVHAKDKSLSGSIRIPSSAIYEYHYYVNNNYSERRTGTYEVKVTGIGSFSECKNITNVKLHEYIFEISSNAFSRCTKLANVDMSDATSLDSIARDAFYSCALKELTMPNSLRIVDDGAFQYCQNLETIHISQNLKRIGGGAFANCPMLENILFDRMEAGETSKLAIIGNNAFKQCNKKLEKVVFPCPELDNIGAMTFWGCTALKLCDLSQTKITKVPEEAFVECNQVREVVVWVSNTGNKSSKRKANSSEVTGILLPRTVTSIEKEAFRQCTGLTEIELPSVNGVGESAFYNCANLSSINLPEVKTIGKASFTLCANLSSINLPEVETIGNSSFSSCANLSSINLPEVKTIGNSSFWSCANLSSMNLPEVETIGNSSFMNCANLSSINLPEVKTIGYSSFENCANLSSINLPSVESIGDYTFCGCDNLSSVNLPAIRYIGYNIFGAAAWLDNLPDGLNYLGTVAFRYVGNMPQGTTIDIKEGTTCIAHLCFCDYRNLAGINIPNSVTEIGENAFQGCGFEDISLPRDITEIKAYTFSGCTNLKEIEMPEKVTKIGENAFYGCSNLETVIIPSSVSNISPYDVFSECTALNDIYNLSEIPQPLSSRVFSAYSATLHVPVGCKEAYEQTEIWKNFDNIIEDAENYKLDSELTEKQKELLRRYDTLLADVKSVLESIKNGSQENAPLIHDVSQLSSPYTEPSEGSLAGLLDGNNSTFWHSNWRNGSVEGGTHYLQADLINPADMEVYLTFTRRPAINDHVTSMSVLGTNDFSAEKSACEELLTFACPYGSNTETITSTIFQTKGYRYLRFYANSTTTGNGFWHISEFQIYSTKKTEALIDQMEEEAARLQAVIDAQAQMDRYGITEEEYNALKEAYDAFMAKLATLTTNVENLTMDKGEWMMKPVIYDLSGRKLAKMQKGVNILRMSDGTTRKVLVK